MRAATGFLAMSLVLVVLFPASFSRAEDVYYLKDGNRAAIVERQLIVYPPGSKRYLALPGRYPTRDGGHTIVVTGKNVTVIRNEPPKGR